MGENMLRHCNSRCTTLLKVPYTNVILLSNEMTKMLKHILVEFNLIYYHVDLDLQQNLH
jgi:hypothetical protein